MPGEWRVARCKKLWVRGKGQNRFVDTHMALHSFPSSFISLQSTCALGPVVRLPSLFEQNHHALHRLPGKHELAVLHSLSTFPHFPSLPLQP